MLKLASLLILFSQTVTQIFAINTLKEVPNFGLNDGNLKMFIHPPKVDDIKNKALVVVLHGCSQNAEKIEFQSGWSELADKYNFLVIYPEQKASNNMSKCFNWFYKKDIDPSSGESSSILEMIDHMKSNYSINVSKVFICGLSAGAAMTVNLLATSPEIFNTGASLAGGPYGSASNFVQAAKSMTNPQIKSAERWGQLIPKSKNNVFPKLIIIHGTKDNIVDFRNANELIKQWSNIKGINLNNKIVNQNFNKNPLIERSEYPDIDNRAQIILYKIKEGTHALPVDPGTRDNQGGNTGAFAVDYNFFSTYYIAKDFGLITD